MNAVGIDVSKGKSTVTILRPFGEIVASPFDVSHTENELSKLVELLRSLDGEIKIVMECTGAYHLPIANVLHESGLFVSAVNPILTHNFNNDTIRKSRNDKTDALKIASYALSNWLKLSAYIPDDDIRKMLKAYNRQYCKYSKLKTMLKNNLIALMDQSFPDVNKLFSSPPRKSDGHEKWLDFADSFWHCECVCAFKPKAFTEKYRQWCKKNRYKFSQSKADEIYADSCGHVSVMPKNDTTKLLITTAVAQVNAICKTIAVTADEMNRLAAMLPEYPVVMAFRGVGEKLCPQLMAEIGDIYRYPKKSSLVRFAGLEPVENQSGQFRGAETISKQGSPYLRRTLFLVMDCLLKHAPADDPIFQFLDRKRAEKKHYRSYMSAGSAKFLRIYYARVKQHLDKYYSEE
jgi:transposase